MRFVPQKIAGVFVVEVEPQIDERGAFVRVFCAEEFARAGIDFAAPQINLSTNAKRHTLRGLHYQDAPFAEAKFVRAVRGSAFDVVVDLRAGSPTENQWISVDLDSRRMNGVYIPEGCAHGFLTLEDDTDILYQMGRSFVAGHGRGVRWNDPAFGIAWPAVPAVMSDRDAAYPARITA
ncbi:MAG: dTDP-4-dehydrorhamnose 3,5-epimerase family protein [Alphaproteobacteria bacterium]|nr:dTDP-4-dehydrorhamnose 3,5-epimerase family protein [Alphaproteobacteria bacterium]